MPVLLDEPTTWGDPALTADRPLPPAGLVARLRGSVSLRRWVPTGPALLATHLLYRTVTRLSGARTAAAAATARAIAGADSSDAELTRIGRRQVGTIAAFWELTWRPRALRSLPVRGAEHLAAARASGRGTLVSFVHLGPELGWIRMAPLTPVAVVLGDWIAEPAPAGYNGLQVEHRRKLLRDAGFQILTVSGSARQVLRVLQVGGVILMALDVPGARKTRFLDRDVEFADGTARMATSTKSLVVPGNLVPDGRRWALEFRPPLDPQDFDSPAALHQALADVHSEMVRASPEHYADPRRSGFWQRADQHGWSRE